MKVKTSFGEYFTGGIYRHYKGNYYMIENVAKLHDSNDIYLIAYHQCDINGIFKSIRNVLPDGEEQIIHQPFCTHETRWHDKVQDGEGNIVNRFTLIKEHQ